MTDHKKVGMPDQDSYANKVYQRLGEFVVVFQWFEDKVLEMITQLVGLERFHEIRPAFARMSFSEKLQVLEVMLATRVAELREKGIKGASDWHQHFQDKKIIQRCRQLNSRRNTVVHSSYIHLESGDEVYGIVRAKMKLRRGSVTIDSADALRDLEDAMKQFADLALDVSLASVQVRNWIGL